MFHEPAPVHHIELKDFPWLWIGAVYPDEIFTVTDTINKSVRPGMRITTHFLENETFHLPHSWKYMDAKTLEEKDFPSEGFVINDANFITEEVPLRDDSS